MADGWLIEQRIRSRVSAHSTFELLAALDYITLLVFWSTIAVSGITAVSLPLLSLRTVTGVAIAVPLPGLLVLELVGLDPEWLGERCIYGVGIGLGLLGLLTVALGLLMPSVVDTGARTVVYAAGGVTLLNVLLIAARAADITSRRQMLTGQTVVRSASSRQTVVWGVGSFSGTYSALTVISMVLLVGLSVSSTYLMNLRGDNTLSYLFAAAVVCVLGLTVTRLIQREEYPLVVFSVSIATLLHRNLATTHVIGADIQLIYYIAELNYTSGIWSTEFGGGLVALPIVTAVPGLLANLTGLSLVMVFKVVMVVFFAIVPLGIYYTVETVFDRSMALYASCFFLFYHITFTFTPGKQLMSEVFMILVILTIVKYELREYGVVVLALLSVGLIMSHYTMTIIYGGSLLLSLGCMVAFSSFLERRTRRLTETWGPPINPLYPVFLLVGGVAWYVAVSGELVSKLLAAPRSLITRVAILVTGENPEFTGTGSSYVATQTATALSLAEAYIDLSRVGLYVLCTGFISVGVAYLLWRREVPNSEDTETFSLFSDSETDEVNRLFYVFIAIPLYVFLGMSYFVHLNLWADRVYQLALVVLSPLIPFGVRVCVQFAARLWARLPMPTVGRRSTIRAVIVTVILVGLFTTNSGLVYALAGVDKAPTFSTNPSGNSFNQEEIDGVNWLESRTEPATIDYRRSFALTGPTGRSFPDELVVYTEPNSYQLFRSVMPSKYRSVRYVYLRRNFNVSELQSGYVFLPIEYVGGTGDTVSRPLISAAQYETIRAEEPGVVYRNDAVIIFRID